MVTGLPLVTMGPRSAQMEGVRWIPGKESDLKCQGCLFPLSFPSCHPQTPSRLVTIIPDLLCSPQMTRGLWD